MREMQLMLPAPVDMHHQAWLCCVTTVMTFAQKGHAHALRNCECCCQDITVLKKLYVCLVLACAIALTKQITKKVEATEQSTCP